MLQREGLRHDLEQREHHEDLDDDADRNAGGTERRFEHGTEDRRADHLATEYEQQDAVQRLLGSIHEAHHAPRPFVAFFVERKQTDAAHARERGFGHREHARYRPTTPRRSKLRSRSSRPLSVTPLSLTLEVAEPREQLLFAAAHRGGLLGFGVVVVEQV